MALRSSIRRRLIALIDRLLPPPRPTSRQLFERRYLVGAIAIDSGWELAESARRHLALDAVVAGAESPFVFVGGRLIVEGEIDVSAVLSALRQVPVPRA